MLFFLFRICFSKNQDLNNDSKLLPGPISITFYASINPKSINFYVYLIPNSSKSHAGSKSYNGVK